MKSKPGNKPPPSFSHRLTVTETLAQFHFFFQNYAFIWITQRSPEFSFCSVWGFACSLKVCLQVQGLLRLHSAAEKAVKPLFSFPDPSPPGYLDEILSSLTFSSCFLFQRKMRPLRQVPCLQVRTIPWPSFCLLITPLSHCRSKESGKQEGNHCLKWWFPRETSEKEDFLARCGGTHPLSQ